MTSAKLDEFVSNVAKSGLLTRAEVDRVRADLPAEWLGDDPKSLARVLVKDGRLTPYQARKLLSGATKGFFLGGYRILRQLGEGGMGKVFLAAKDADGHRVAIKVLPPKKALEEEQALVRFRREMDISRRLRHPNIALTLDVGEEDGAHFMVMEHVKGRSLYEIVREHGPLGVPIAAEYFLKVLDGLNAAHVAGLVHRDVKPSNLMMTPDGDAKILDLGLARSREEDSGLTKANVILGTLDYAAPEQLGNAGLADVRSDLYSLGCTMYFALAGYPPFDGGDLINKIYRQRMEDPVSLERAAKNVPAAFAAIVRKLMAKNPEHRYQTGLEVQADLTRWTDPEVAKAFLLAETERDRAQIRLPSPELDDDDLQFLDDDLPQRPRIADFGDPEPDAAPRGLASLSPREMIHDLDAVSPFRANRSAQASGPPEDPQWTTRVILIALLLGSIFILIAALLL